jgi:hypothetical protein
MKKPYPAEAVNFGGVKSSVIDCRLPSLTFALDFVILMKARVMFICSVILMFGALAMVLRGRVQLSGSFQAWHGGDHEVFRDFAHRGGWFIYPAWVLAVGGVACLVASYRRREPAWRWTVAVLVVLFLLLGLGPV